MQPRTKPLIRDYYAVLGLKPDSSSGDVRLAYLRLARRFHPDRNSGDREATERFKEIAEAYRVLSDDGSRLKYNCFGLREGDTSGDVVTRGFQKDQLGEDVELALEITLSEHMKGTKRMVVYSRRVRCNNCRTREAVACPLCSGTGKVAFSDAVQGVLRPCVCCYGTGNKREPCRTCGSTGFILVAESCTVVIQPGGVAGKIVTLPGMGHHGSREGAAGTLNVMLRLTDLSPFFINNGELWCDLPVTLSTAVLGGEIEIPTPWGWRTVKLDSGTQSGTVLRLKGLGLRTEYGGGLRKASLHVRVIPEIPGGDTPVLRALFRRLKEHESGSISPARRIFGNPLAQLHERIASDVLPGK